jgi:hypothetical protein
VLAQGQEGARVGRGRPFAPVDLCRDAFSARCAKGDAWKQPRSNRTTNERSVAQNRWSGLVGLNQRLHPYQIRGLSAVRTGVFPGRARASRAKLCVLSGPVPSGAGKPG